MFVIGLTGSTGAGKTTVSNLFAKRQVPIIDADVIAHEITKINTPAFLKIVDHFGKAILKPDGSLNRAALRERIFQEASAKAWLETLLHPLIQAEMKAAIDQISAPYCIVVIPLLFETGPYPYLDRILLVDAPREAKMARVSLRDGIPPEAVSSMLEAQIPPTRARGQADDIIENSGDLSALSARVEALHQQYLALS